MKKRRLFWLLVSIAQIILSVVLSQSLNLDSAKVKAIGLLCASLTLWITETLPMSVATLFLVFSMPFLNLMTYDDIISNFGLSTSLFIMASSGITIAIARSNLPKMITSVIFQKAKKHPAILVYSLGMAITFFSGFVSSLATCSLFAALVSTALKDANLDAKNSRIGKALMIIIPACSGIGGFISPAGTPANIMVIDLLKEAGINLSFFQWFSVGFPVAMITAFVFLSSVLLIIGPTTEEIDVKRHVCRLTSTDIIVLSVTTMVIIGWFLSSFVPFLNTTNVAILGLIILFFPFAEVLDIDMFGKGVNWDLVLTMGFVSVLMTGIAGTGVISDFANLVFGKATRFPTIVVLFVVSLSICIIRAFVPTTTAVIALLAPMLLEISHITSISYTSLLLIAAFWAAAALLLVFTEPIYLITYKEKYYSQKDLLKVGAIPSALGSTVVTALIYFLSNIVAA